MTLFDTGPMVAFVNTRDQNHTRCRMALKRVSRPFVTTWICIAEAMYLLGEAGGYTTQNALWDFLYSGVFEIHSLEVGEARRMRELMRQYRDAPMDLADASLVVAAETTGTRRVFTLDRHFYAYRCADGSAFEVIPGP